MESSQWARSNSAPNFGVMTPLVVKIDIKKIIWHFFSFLKNWVKQTSLNQFGQKRKFLDHLETHLHTKFHEVWMIGYGENHWKPLKIGVFGHFCINYFFKLLSDLLKLIPWCVFYSVFHKKHQKCWFSIVFSDFLCNWLSDLHEILCEGVSSLSKNFLFWLNWFGDVHFTRFFKKLKKLKITPKRTPQNY